MGIVVTDGGVHTMPATKNRDSNCRCRRSVIELGLDLESQFHKSLELPAKRFVGMFLKA